MLHHKFGAGFVVYINARDARGNKIDEQQGDVFLADVFDPRGSDLSGDNNTINVVVK